MRNGKAMAMGVLVVLALSATVASAQMRYLPTAPGTWKPWRFVAYADPQRELGARPADMKELEAQLLRLNAILMKTPGFAQPMGFSVETVGSLEPEPMRPGSGAGQLSMTARPLPAMLNFGAYPIMEFGSGASAKRDDTGETTQVLFFVNQLTQPLFQSLENRVPEFEALDSDVARLAAPQPDVRGMARYGDTLVLKKSAEPIWTAVSQAEALDLLARSIERRLADERDAAGRLQSVHDEAKDPKKREERMAQYRKIAPLQKDPAYLDKMTKVEEMKAMQADALMPQIESARAMVTRSEQELARTRAAARALSAADKTAPACYASAQESLARFRRAPAPACESLVRPNWKMFNPALPRSAPQLLTIAHVTPCLRPDIISVHVGGCPANKRLIESLDTAALLAWLQ